jgi:hypothetical protein
LFEASQINYFIWFDLFIFLIIYFFFYFGMDGILRIVFSFIRNKINCITNFRQFYGVYYLKIIKI